MARPVRSDGNNAEIKGHVHAQFLPSLQHLCWWAGIGFANGQGTTTPTIDAGDCRFRNQGTDNLSHSGGSRRRLYCPVEQLRRLTRYARDAELIDNAQQRETTYHAHGPGHA